MAVHCRQIAEGVPDQQYVIEPHRPDQTDAELLAAKAKGAREKGWTVRRTGYQRFTATKDRWGGVLCTREFWSD